MLEEIMRAVNAMTTKLRVNTAAEPLSAEQYRKLALGAIYSEQQSAFLNSLTTGLDADWIRERLEEWWGVEDHDQAVETLNYLAEKGHRFCTPMVLAACMAPELYQETVLQNCFPDEDDLARALSQLENIQETYEELVEDKVIEKFEDLQIYGAAAWDIGRLVFVARLCFDAGYISPTEAWSFIERGYQLADKTFYSWESFAKSYVIGRAMWGGVGSFNSGIATIANYLLVDEKSPWVELGWK